MHVQEPGGGGGGGGGRGRGSERDRILSRLLAQHGAQCRAQPHNPKIMTFAESRSCTLNQMSHPGAPIEFYYKSLYRNVGVCFKEGPH